LGEGKVYKYQKLSLDIMETKQINLKLSKNLIEAAKIYSDSYGYKNIQELIAESMREKIFEKSDYDETFASDEINLIDDLIKISIKNNDLGTEEELKKALQ
jgi:hypothetical protein